MVERRSLTGELSLSCSRPAADGWFAVYLSVCLSVCLSVSSNFFQIATPPTVFVWFSRNLAHIIYVPVSKKLQNRFSKFIFWNFWLIFESLHKFGHNLCSRCSDYTGHISVTCLYSTVIVYRQSCGLKHHVLACSMSYMLTNCVWLTWTLLLIVVVVSCKCTWWTWRTYKSAFRITQRECIIYILLSASLYVSKRGAYWDRLCRDVVGWLVGCHARALWPNGAS